MYPWVWQSWSRFFGALLPTPDAGDLMMKDATVAGTSDATYELDSNGVHADEDDLTLLKNASVGETVLE